MAFQSKTYSLSDEVVAAIEAGRERDGSPNKFLRRVLGIDDDASLQKVQTAPSDKEQPNEE